MHRIIAACGATFLMILPAHAGDVPQSVRAACKSDYFKHCSQHQPDSPGVRDCMAGAFDKLSAPCSSAILNSNLADGYKSKSSDTASKKVAKTTNSKRNVAEAKKGSQKVANGKKGSSKVAEGKSRSRVAQSGSVKSGSVKSGNANRYYASAEDKPSFRYNKPHTVSGYIQRGTGIANYYINRYARIW